MKISRGLQSIELCAGGGGQALGLELAGFAHVALVENDKHACNTLRRNRPTWNVVESSLSAFSATGFGDIDLVAGGVPCPPFSRAGAQLGERDERNLFPDALRIIAECRPRAVMFENVRGLLDSAFDGYRREIGAQLAELGLRLQWGLLQASDFGVPQLRPRAVGIALRDQDWPFFEWPTPQVRTPTVGEALREDMAERGWLGAEEWSSNANRIAPTLVGGSKKHGGADLGPTRAKRQWSDLGVDGLVLADFPPDAAFSGRPRLTVKMTAKLQGFPAEWNFIGGKTAAYRQVGNAFPPPVAYHLGMAIANALAHLRRRADDNRASINFGDPLVEKRQLRLSISTE